MVTIALAVLLAQNPAVAPAGLHDTRKPMAALALQRSQNEIPPVPLEPGSTARGMVFDAFRLYQLAARDALRAGGRLTADGADQLNAPPLLIVAHPVECAGVRVAPVAVALIGRNPQAPRDGVLSGEALRKWLPGVPLPEGAIGGGFNQTFGPDAAVKITYSDDGCRAPQVVLSLSIAQPRKKINVPPAWPVGVLGTPANGPVQVVVRAIIDVDGVPKGIEVMSGPTEFNLPAVAAVRQWRYEPVRVNGVAIPYGMTVVVGFRTRQMEASPW